MIGSFEKFYVCNLQIIRTIIAEKKKFFKDFWHVVDVITAVSSLLAIAFYGGRVVHANTAIEKITADVNKGDFFTDCNL